MCGNLYIVWHCPSLGLEWKQIFSSCGHCWVFQICWHTEYTTLTVSYFGIWNSSAGISSTSTSFVCNNNSKTHWTSHSRMSGSRWMTKPSWLSGTLKHCFVCSSVHFCHFFLIYSALLDPHFSVLFCVHLCVKCSLHIYNVLEEISSLSHSIVLYFFALFT